MFQQAKKAGLKPSELAALLGVSRVAVYNWKAGRTKPHKLLKERIIRVIAVLDDWMDDHELPLSEDLTPAERKSKIGKLKTAIDKTV